jgi:hypothetical protein
MAGINTTTITDKDNDGLDIDAGGAVTIDAAGISLDSAGVAANLTVASDGAGEDLTIAVTGATDSSVHISSTGTAADALTISTSAGGMDITVAGAAAGEDLDITSNSSVNITSSENVADAVVINASAGGVDITAAGAAGEDIDIANTAGSVNISAGEADASAIKLNASAGSIDIDSADNITVDAADDISITTTSADGLITIHSAHTAGQAVLIDANAASGAILDIDAGIIDIDVQGDVTIDADSLKLGNTSAGAGILHIMEDTDNGSNYSGFTVGNMAANVVYTLPTDDGSNGQQLTTNGSAVLSWAAAGASGGDGTMTTIKLNDSQVGGSDIVTLDFSSNFTATESPDTEIQIGIAPAQTTITSILATDVKIGEDDETKIDFEDANKINFYANNAKEMVLEENSLSPGTSDGTALGTTSLMWSDLFLASGGVVNFNNGDVTLTHSSNTVTVAGGTLATAALTTSTIVASGIIKTDDTTEATSTTDGSLQTDGGLSVAKDAVIGDDLKMLSDASVIHFGADSEVTLTHVADTGLTMTHTATGDNKPMVLQLKSEEDAIIANEVIASLEFAAGDSDGTDGATVAAGIHAIAEGTFSASANATKLVFTTGASETAASSATAKMTLSSGGDLTLPTDGSIIAIGATDSNTAVTNAANLSQINLGDTYWNGTSGDTVKLKLWDAQSGSPAADEFMGIGVEGNRMVFINSNENYDWKWQHDATVKMTLDSGDASLDVVGDIIGATINADGDTSAGDNAAMGYTSGEGLILTGQGSTNDVTIKNDADTAVIQIPTGGTAVTIAGALTTGGILKTDDTTEATSTTDGSLQTDGGLSVAKDAVIGDDLILLSDSCIIKMGAGNDATLTHDGSTGLTIAATPISIDSTGELHLNSTTGDIKLQDGGTDQIAFDLDGTAGLVIMKLMVDSDDFAFQQYDGTEVFRVEDNGDFDIAGGAGSSGVTINASGQITADGRILVDDTTEATSTTDGSLQTDGGLSVAKDAVIGDDLILLSDAAVIHFGADKEITLAHDADVGLTIKHGASADDKPVVLTLESSEAALEAGEVIGQINFKPGDSDGTDGAAVSAAIQAVAEATFAADNNQTALTFMLGRSEDATGALEKMKITSAGELTVNSVIASSANAGGTLNLVTDDGAAMSNGHILGKIHFRGAEDNSSNYQTGAKIEAECAQNWSNSENSTALKFYTMSANAQSDLTLTLKSGKDAEFAGGVTTTGTQIYTPASVVNLSSNGAAIPTTSAYVKVDANGADRNNIVFANAGTAGQILIVENSGGEDLSFHNTEGNSLLQGVDADNDTMAGGKTFMFVSNGSRWIIIGGGAANRLNNASGLVAGP